MSNQFKCDVDVYTTADSGARDPRACQIGVFHTTENDDATDPVSVARWQQNRANGSSYNILVGTDGKTVRSNDDNYIPWAAGTTGNRVGSRPSPDGPPTYTPATAYPLYGSPPSKSAPVPVGSVDTPKYRRLGEKLTTPTPAPVSPMTSCSIALARSRPAHQQRKTRK